MYKDNPYDAVKIKLGLNDTDELLADRRQLLEKIAIPTSNDFDLLATSPFITPELLGFVRVFNMNKGEKESFKTDKYNCADSVLIFRSIVSLVGE